MFERFTDRARHALMLAHEEARRRGDLGIGPHALLLGLYFEGGGIAARVLRSEGWTPEALDGTSALAAIGIDIDAVRAAVEESFGEGALDNAMAASEHAADHTYGRPEWQLVSGSVKEAIALGHNYIGTEHILLALEDYVRIPDLRQKVLAELEARISGRP